MANKNLELAQEWFNKAKADIDFARIGFKETEHYGQVCFLCQQAVEKYLKGFLVAKGIKPKKIHSTATLVRKCAQISKEFSDFISLCKILDRYYIPTRYPVLSAALYKKEDAQEALQILDGIVNLVNKLLKIYPAFFRGIK